MSKTLNNILNEAAEGEAKITASAVKLLQDIISTDPDIDKSLYPKSINNDLTDVKSAISNGGKIATYVGNKGYNSSTHGKTALKIKDSNNVKNSIDAFLRKTNKDLSMKNYAALEQQYFDAIDDYAEENEIDVEATKRKAKAFLSSRLENAKKYTSDAEEVLKDADFENAYKAFTDTTENKKNENVKPEDFTSAIKNISQQKDFDFNKGNTDDDTAMKKLATKLIKAGDNREEVEANLSPTEKKLMSSNPKKFEATIDKMDKNSAIEKKLITALKSGKKLSDLPDEQKEYYNSNKKEIDIETGEEISGKNTEGKNTEGKNTEGKNTEGKNTEGGETEGGETEGGETSAYKYQKDSLFDKSYDNKTKEKTISKNASGIETLQKQIKDIRKEYETKLAAAKPDSTQAKRLEKAQAKFIKDSNMLSKKLDRAESLMTVSPSQHSIKSGVDKAREVGYTLDKINMDLKRNFRSLEKDTNIQKLGKAKDAVVNKVKGTNAEITKRTKEALDKKGIEEPSKEELKAAKGQAKRDLAKDAIKDRLNKVRSGAGDNVKRKLDIGDEKTQEVVDKIKNSEAYKNAKDDIERSKMVAKGMPRQAVKDVKDSIKGSKEYVANKAKEVANTVKDTKEKVVGATVDGVKDGVKDGLKKAKDATVADIKKTGTVLKTAADVATDKIPGKKTAVNLSKKAANAIKNKLSKKKEEPKAKPESEKEGPKEKEGSKEKASPKAEPKPAPNEEELKAAQAQKIKDAAKNPSKAPTTAEELKARVKNYAEKNKQNLNPEATSTAAKQNAASAKGLKKKDAKPELEKQKAELAQKKLDLENKKVDVADKAVDAKAVAIANPNNAMKKAEPATATQAPAKVVTGEVEDANKLTPEQLATASQKIKQQRMLSSNPALRTVASVGDKKPAQLPAPAAPAVPAAPATTAPKLTPEQLAARPSDKLTDKTKSGVRNTIAATKAQAEADAKKTGAEPEAKADTEEKVDVGSIVSANTPPKKKGTPKKKVIVKTTGKANTGDAEAEDNTPKPTGKKTSKKPYIMTSEVIRQDKLDKEEADAEAKRLKDAKEADDNDGTPEIKTKKQRMADKIIGIRKNRRDAELKDNIKELQGSKEDSGPEDEALTDIEQAEKLKDGLKKGSKSMKDVVKDADNPKTDTAKAIKKANAEASDKARKDSLAAEKAEDAEDEKKSKKETASQLAKAIKDSKAKKEGRLGKKNDTEEKIKDSSVQALAPDSMHKKKADEEKEATDKEERKRKAEIARKKRDNAGITQKEDDALSTKDDDESKDDENKDGKKKPVQTQSQLVTSLEAEKTAIRKEAIAAAKADKAAKKKKKN